MLRTAEKKCLAPLCFDGSILLDCFYPDTFFCKRGRWTFQTLRDWNCVIRWRRKVHFHHGYLLRLQAARKCSCHLILLLIQVCSWKGRSVKSFCSGIFSQGELRRFSPLYPHVWIPKRPLLPFQVHSDRSALFPFKSSTTRSCVHTKQPKGPSKGGNVWSRFSNGTHQDRKVLLTFPFHVQTLICTACKQQYEIPSQLYFC